MSLYFLNIEVPFNVYPRFRSDLLDIQYHPEANVLLYNITFPNLYNDHNVKVFLTCSEFARKYYLSGKPSLEDFENFETDYGTEKIYPFRRIMRLLNERIKAYVEETDERDSDNISFSEIEEEIEEFFKSFSENFC